MSASRAVIIRCPGGYIGEAISARGFLKMRCREQRCRAPDGSRPVHVWDLRSGWLVDERQMTPDETADDDKQD